MIGKCRTAPQGMDERDLVADVLVQTHSAELAEIAVYETALRCARREVLRREWGRNLRAARRHAGICIELLHALDAPAGVEPRSAHGAGLCGAALVELMEATLASCDDAVAQSVAAECIVAAEANCRVYWDLVGDLARLTGGTAGLRLRAACAEVEARGSGSHACG